MKPSINPVDIPPSTLEQISQAIYYKEAGQLDKSVELLEIAVLNDPNHPEANYNLGTALKNLGRLDEAAKFLEKAVQLAPTTTSPLNNLALCLNEMGQKGSAVIIFKKALQLEPKNPLLAYNLANLYLEIGKFNSAIHWYKQAIKQQPNVSEMHANLGIAYLLISNEKAIPSLKKAIELSPQTIEYYYTLAYVFEKARRLEEAIDYYQKTVDLDDNYQLALSHLFVNKRRLCSWNGLKELDAKLANSHKESPWASLVRTEDLQSNMLAGYRWSQEIEQKYLDKLFDFKKRAKVVKHKLRIGYISGHFGNHPVSFTTAGVFDLHNREGFEVVAYSYGREDEFTKNIIDSVDKFVNLQKLTDEQAARKIYKDQIDILVDLTGYTEGNRAEILAMRPAPIQITWAGLSATTGAKFIDYFIADKIIVPIEDQRFYSEKILYLPECFCPFNSKMKIKTTKYRKHDFGLPENKFVFAVLNQMYKIEPIIFEAWMNILKKVPESVLWIASQNTTAEHNLLGIAQTHGVSSDRVIFVKQSGIEDFVSRIELADLVLDTLVYGGGTTSYFALRQGVPVLTFRGSHPASSWSASLLTEAGLNHLIANSLPEYQKMAVELAQNPVKLEKYQKMVRKFVQKIPQNTLKKVRILEKSYLKIWSDWQQQLQQDT